MDFVHFLAADGDERIIARQIFQWVSDETDDFEKGRQVKVKDIGKGELLWVAFTLPFRTFV